MSFNWLEETKKAKESGGNADRIPEGYAKVTVSKVVTGKKDGTSFLSSKGDPQVMLVFSDAEDREAAQMYTISDRAQWKLLQTLTALNADMQKMSDAGLEPHDLTDKDTATQHLVGLEGWAYVEHVQGGKYTNVDIVELDQVPADVLQKAKASKPATVPADIDEDDIPF